MLYQARDVRSRLLTAVIMLALAATSLTGCANPQKIASEERQTCEDYGFEPGTPQFSQCFMQIDQARIDRAHAMAMAYFSHMQQAQPRTYMTMPMGPNMMMVQPVP